MNFRTTAAAALTVLSAALLAAPAADAGTYRVSACRDLHNTAYMPVGDAQYGWHSTSDAAAARLEDQCDSVKASLYAQLGRDLTTANGRGAKWTYYAPAGTSITGYEVWWAGRAIGGGSSYAGLVTESPHNSPNIANRSFGSETALFGGTDHFAYDGVDLSQFSLYAVCNLESGCQGNNSADDVATFRMYRSVTTLLDQDAPTGTASGSALSDTTWHGTETVNVSGTDAGGGVYRGIVGIDDGTRSVTIDQNGGRCASVQEDDAFVFAYPRPCPSSGAATMSLDTTAYADGEHVFRVLLQDAGRNTTQLGQTVTRVVDNLPPVIGAVRLSGGTREGDDLSCAPTSIDGQDPKTTYQWIRAAIDGSGAAAIPGATTGSYRVSGADLGRKLLCRITAEDRGGTTSRDSAITDPPFDGGKVVMPYCSDRPTGVRDECGDLDGDGKLNRADDDIDGDGIPNDSDPDRYAKVAVAAPSNATPSSPGSVTTKETTSTVKEVMRDSARDIGESVPRGALNGDGASDDARLSVSFDGSGGTQLTSSFGRNVPIRGVLVDGRGAPIKGASVELMARAAHAAAAWSDQSGTVTRADGSFVSIVPKNVSSRTLTFRYRSHAGDDRPAATASLDLRVRAGVTLAVTPRSSHNHGTIRFSGKLLGRPIPVRGKVVELQARARGTRKWITFRTIRSTHSGAFTARYRFRATYGSITYEFRARARQEGTYPFLTGASRSVSVRVR
jgi:hypothetical protein